MLPDEVVTISCTACGDGEFVGENGDVYPLYENKIGDKRCVDCNGVGWVVERVELKFEPE